MSNEYKDYTMDRYNELVEKLNKIEDLANLVIDKSHRYDLGTVDLCVDILKILKEEK